jgi:CheY-like chemotaxis protein
MATLIPPASASAKALHIAMVDDDPQLLGVWVRVLRAGGFEVEGFDDPQRLLEVLGTRPFDAIVTDLEMPGLDGSELCAKAQDRFHHAPPFVLHTGAAQLLSRAARGRFAAVLDKPCDRRQMFDAVRHAAAGGAAARS